MRKLKNLEKTVGYLILLAPLCLGSLSWVEASGKKPPTNYPSCDPKTNPPYTPNPVRNVILKQVGTQPFQLPNGAVVDFNADLQSLLVTSATESSNFSPTDPQPYYPCQSYLELRSAVTTFQLDIVEGGVSFGYNPGGSLGPISGITGTVDVSIGNISMDFSIWKCTAGNCSAVAATSANHLTAGAHLNAKMDFNQIKTSADLVFKTPLGIVLRAIMQNGLEILNAVPSVSELPWEARVKELIPSKNSLVIDAGDQYRLSPNQSFAIYAPTDSSTSGSCNVYHLVAYIRTSEVSPISSLATVDQLLDPGRGIQREDIVIVRKTCAK